MLGLEAPNRSKILTISWPENGEPKDIEEQEKLFFVEPEANFLNILLPKTIKERIFNVYRNSDQLEFVMHIPISINPYTKSIKVMDSNLMSVGQVCRNFAWITIKLIVYDSNHKELFIIKGLRFPFCHKLYIYEPKKNW